MENLNAEKIIKVLEHCSNWTAEKGCKGCPYEDNCIDEDVIRDALSLITSQEQRIEAYRQELGEVRVALAEANKERQELTEENERLRAEKETENKELFYKWEKIADETADRYEALYQDAKKALKADTVRKMHDKLAQYIGTYTEKDKIPIIEMFRLLDKFEKEMFNDE